MKVPFYEYRDRNATYEDNNYNWVDLELFLKVLNNDVLNEFWDLDAFSLDDIDQIKWQEKIKKYPPVSVDGDNFVEFWTFIIASKVLYTTWFTCEYGLWKHGTWNHHGIDIILPKNTPIESFSDGEVVRIKNWDGVKKDEWNCIVIKSNIDWEDLYLCYEHLEKILVKKWDKIEKWQQIWTCGSTWNSTTNHLHFQIDNDKAPFHPYWSKNILDTNKFCIDPWAFLQKNYVKNNPINNKSDITNKPKHNSNTEAKDDDNLVIDLVSTLEKDKQKDDFISFFKNSWILKWDHWNFYLDQPLKRYHFALILYRLIKKWFIKIPHKDCEYYFTDIDKNDKEFNEALKTIVCTGIMRWENNKFFPWDNLTWEQFLAIVWRIFENLKNSKTGNWYDSYLNWAKEQKIIDNNWNYIWKAITRNEVFSILYKLIFPESIV